MKIWYFYFLCSFMSSIHALSFNKWFMKTFFKKRYERQQELVKHQEELKKGKELQYEEKLIEKIKEVSHFVQEELKRDQKNEIVTSQEYEKHLLFKKKLAHGFLEQLAFDWRGKIIVGSQYASFTLYSTDTDCSQVVLYDNDLQNYLERMALFKSVYANEKFPRQLPHDISKRLLAVEKNICEHIRFFNEKIHLRHDALKAQSNQLSEDAMEDQFIMVAHQLELKKHVS